MVKQHSDPKNRIEIIAFRVWGGAVVVVIIGLCLLSWPYLASGYALEQAGQSLHSPPADPRQAALKAEQAVRRTPQEAHAYYLLGQAHLASGEFESALSALDRYTQLRPDNPGGKLDLSIAYYKGGQPESALTICQETGLSGQAFLQIARTDLAQMNYNEARLWTECAMQRGAEPAEVKYVQGQIYAEQGEKELARQAFKATRTLNPDLLPELVVTDTTRFRGNDFLVPPDNDLITVRPFAGEEKVLVIYGNESTRLNFYTPYSDQFLLTIRALNDNPPPVEIKINLDGLEVQTFSFDRGDNIWTEKTTTVNLSGGKHNLDVSFVNNYGALSSTGEWINDRNAYIAWLALQRIPQN